MLDIRHSQTAVYPPWSTSNEMDAEKCIKLGYSFTTSAHSPGFVIFSAIFFLLFSSSSHISSPSLPTLISYLSHWDPSLLPRTNNFPLYSPSNRGCAAEPGGGPAD